MTICWDFSSQCNLIQIPNGLNGGSDPIIC
jgi:hypothetical protein